MKISAKIPYTADVGGFSGRDLLLHWLALGVMAGGRIHVADRLARVTKARRLTCLRPERIGPLRALLER